jgi:hypothetical protein
MPFVYSWEDILGEVIRIEAEAASFLDQISR